MYKIELIIGPDTKLAELILEYPGLIDALAHLNIKLGFGDRSVKEVAEYYRINLEAFMVIIYTYCNHLDPGKTIKKEALADLLVFLKNSHDGFKRDQIPELKNLIASFAEEIPSEHGKILVSFFDGYIHEVYEHFEYEDETVFPYINAILNDQQTNGFVIHDFERNHTDIEQKLYELKNILIKYIPEEASEYHIKIIRNLFDFEKQLYYHTNLEDRVLAPSVKKMERKERRGK
ncbi:MAG: hemerythrin domain-containing protein [Bacteroidales bacterium]|jgi:regulator of cell morphogenesis and NO signaling|nr:hemerythrin domain-containing protein [Bacteroidales bacterium]